MVVLTVIFDVYVVFKLDSSGLNNRFVILPDDCSMLFQFDFAVWDTLMYDNANSFTALKHTSRTLNLANLSIKKDTRSQCTDIKVGMKCFLLSFVVKLQRIQNVALGLLSIIFLTTQYTITAVK